MTVLRARRRREWAQLAAAGWQVGSGLRVLRLVDPAGDASAAGRGDATAQGGTVTPASGRRPVPGWFVVDCPACRTLVGPSGLAEAEQWAGAHDDSNHRGVPTAEIRPDDGPEAA